MNSSLVRLFPPDSSSGSASGLDSLVGDPFIEDPFIEDPFSEIAAEHRPPPEGRPWVLTNMVASLDGAISIDGRSGKLGGAADAIVFGALRAICDVVVVGATTAIAEAYRAPKPTGEQQSRRAERGQARRPRLAIVSGSLSFPLDLPALLEADRSDPDRTDQAQTGQAQTDPVLVFTGSAAPRARLEALAEVAEVVVSPSESVHPGWLLTELAARSLRIALLEGGPTLNGQFLAADLIDEWNLTISPLLTGGTSGRAVSGGANHAPVDFELDRVWTGGGLLFGRWTRPSSDTGSTTR